MIIFFFTLDGSIRAHDKSNLSKKEFVQYRQYFYQTKYETKNKEDFNLAWENHLKENMQLNKIYLGDCLELMKDIPTSSVDMILCDLPYGTTACKWDSVIPFDKLWEQYKRVLKPNSAIVLTAAQPFTSALITSNILQFKYCWIWKKPQGVDPFMAKHRPLNNYEDVCVFSNGKVPYFPQMQEGKPYRTTRDKNGRVHELTGAVMQETTTENEGVRLPTRVLDFKQQKGLHPTQKPVALFEYLIRTYTNEGDTVLDNCIGSGTTAVAAINTGRNFIGIEMDENYHKIATERVRTAMDEPALLASE